MKKYRSEISAYIHEAAKDLQAIGLMEDDKMRELDNLCLVNNSTQPKSTKPFSPLTRVSSNNHVALSA